LKWDGGDWREPDIESEVELEGESDNDETELEDDIRDEGAAGASEGDEE
jgi:hypothetical protein